MSKRIFITGGAGFIGSAIVSHLLRAGYEVMVYDNLSFGRRNHISILPDSSFVNGDILDFEKLNDSLKKFAPQYIIHLAAIHFIPYCNQHPFESANINIKGTSNVLEAARELKSFEKFFFASTAAVYPIYDLAINETLPPLPTDIYGLSKYAGEELVKKFHLETKIPSIICRFFNAFGPNETNPHLIPEIASQLSQGSRSLKLGNIIPKRDFIHTQDMARAVKLLLEKFNSGTDVFNLGQGKEYSVSEVVAAFEKALSEKIGIENDPLKTRKSDRLHLLADITKIKAFTGWMPLTTLEAGIATLIK